MAIPTVAYLGPEGTFTEEALAWALDGRAQGVAMASINEALTACAEGACDLALVPIENSLEGTVHATLDALVHRYELLAVGEVILPIHQQLLGVAGATVAHIRRVLSHPQALAQTRRFRSAFLSAAEEIPTASTADAARTVAELADPDVAAIAPARAATRWGLSILSADIEDDPINETRFWLVAKGRLPEPTGSDRTAVVCFQVSDRPGSLLALLTAFAARGINLTKLESRPTRESLGAYLFVIELEGHVTDPAVAAALADLALHGVRVKLLGSFPAARVRPTPPPPPAAPPLPIDPELPRLPRLER
jgi:prephenate dehydratase